MGKVDAIPDLKKYWYVIFLLILVSGVSTLCYHIMIKSWDGYSGGNSTLEKEHFKYINGEYTSSLRYRILVPYMIEFFRVSTSLSVPILYDIYHLIFLSLSLVMFFYLLKRWHTNVYALLGSLLLCILFQLGYNLIHPEDTFMLFAFITGIYLIVNSRNNARSNVVCGILIAILIFVATFSKETTAFIVIFYAIFKISDYIKTKNSVHMIMLALVILALLAALVVSGRLTAYANGLFTKNPYANTSGFYQFALVSNLTDLGVIFGFFCFYNIIPILAFMNFKKRPYELKYLTYGMSIYFLSTFFVGLIGEWRNQIPVMLVLIPLFLFTLKEKFDAKE